MAGRCADAETLRSLSFFLRRFAVEDFHSVVSLVLPVLADRTRDGETGCCLCGMEPGHTATVVTEAVVFGAVLGVVYENYGDPHCVVSVVWDAGKV